MCTKEHAAGEPPVSLDDVRLRRGILEAAWRRPRQPGENLLTPEEESAVDRTREGERALARDLWVDKSHVFTSETGEPLNPSTDYHHWKRLLREAGIRDGRLHDARHTASTVPLLLGVPERIVMAVMGWSSTSMAQRYQHVTEPMLKDVGKKIGAALWGGAVDAADARGGSAA